MLEEVLSLWSIICYMNKVTADWFKGWRQLKILYTSHLVFFKTCFHSTIKKCFLFKITSSDITNMNKSA